LLLKDDDDLMIDDAGTDMFDAVKGNDRRTHDAHRHPL
jgi:hypothetical protein